MKKIMFPILSFFFFVVFAIFPLQISAQVSQDAVLAFRSANVRILDQPQTTRNFTLPLLDGTNAALNSYSGKVVILNFWATWCPPCRAEMPSMENLYRRFKNDGLEILAVDMGEDTATVNQYIKNNGFSFPVMFDRLNRVGTAYGVTSIPTSLILDREGKIIAKVVGSFEWDAPHMIAAFDALLKSK